MSCKILAIDTSTEACSVALLIDHSIREQFKIAPREHANIILPMLSSLLSDSQISLQQLDAIAFGCGPGSFTGLRIAAGITQGLAFGANLPVISVSTLQALAQGAYRESAATHIMAALDARMQQVYWGCFIVDENKLAQAVTAEMVCAPDDIIVPDGNNWIGVGSGWEAYQAALQNKIGTDKVNTINGYPHAYDIATIAATKWSVGNYCSAAQALPIYLRDKVVA